MTEPRVAHVQLARACGLRPRVDDARQIAEVVGDRRCERQRRRRRRAERERAGKEPAARDRARHRSRAASTAASPSRPSTSARPSAPARTESHSPSCPESPSVTRAETTPRVARHGLVDAGLCLRKRLGVFDGHPHVMTDMCVDVGRHEGRDGRVVRRETQSQRPLRARREPRAARRQPRRRSPSTSHSAGSPHSHAAVLRTCSTRTEFRMPGFKGLRAAPEKKTPPW